MIAPVSLIQFFRLSKWTKVEGRQEKEAFDISVEASEKGFCYVGKDQ